MASIRDSLRGTTGIVVAVALLLVGLGVGAYEYRSANSTVDATRRDMFIDAETGKAFAVTLEPGMMVPVKSPDTGKMTGVPAELCYWTADGGTKKVPDAVLLNAKHIPPLPGPTFCPYCHRLVVAHNPAPGPGVMPPPTEAEYNQRSSPSAAVGEPPSNAQGGR